MRDAYRFRISNIVIDLLLSMFEYYITLLRFPINFTLFSLTLYVDKRLENFSYFILPDEAYEYGLMIGMAPFNYGHEMGNFVGSIKKFVYYPNTKYKDEFRGEGKFYYN